MQSSWNFAKFIETNMVKGQYAHFAFVDNSEVQEVYFNSNATSPPWGNEYHT